MFAHAGYNGYGQLGDNSTTLRKEPTLVSGAGNWTVLPKQGYMAGTGFTCAIRSNQTLWCWVCVPAPGVFERGLSGWRVGCAGS